MSDAKLTRQLGPEETVGDYGIRPTAGYTDLRMTLPGNQAGGSDHGGGLRCVWTGLAGAGGVSPYLQMDVSTEDRVAGSGVSSADGVQIGFEVAARNHTDMIYSPVETGTINGLGLSRGCWKGYGQKTGKCFHGLVYARVMAPNVVTVVGRDAEPSSRRSLPLLEASALTLRKL